MTDAQRIAQLENRLAQVERQLARVLDELHLGRDDGGPTTTGGSADVTL